MKDDSKQTPTPANIPQDDNGQLAANVTREQIKQIYEASEGTFNPPVAPDHEAPGQQSPYMRTHNSNFDWRQYHSAWQDYYKEYYRRYYDHLHSKKAMEESSQAKVIAGDDSARVEELRNDILSQVKSRAKKIKHSSHFWPLVSAVVVGLVFLFIQFNSVVFAQVEAYVSPGALEGKKLVINDPTGSTAVSPDPRLIIPKINVDIPVNFDVTSLAEHDIQSALETAAVHYKIPGANALPGQFGNSVILGHSSNDVFAPGEYKFAFVLADHLVPGDTFYVHYKSTRYTYKVTGKKVINPTELDALQLGSDKPMTTLVTCTPPGTALNRLLIYAEQINPDPAGAEKAPASEPSPSDTQQLPGNAPTLLERLLGMFF